MATFFRNTVASPGTVGCRGSFIDLLRLLIRQLTPTTACGSPSPPAFHDFVHQRGKRASPSCTGRESRAATAFTGGKLGTFFCGFFLACPTSALPIKFFFQNSATALTHLFILVFFCYIFYSPLSLRLCRLRNRRAPAGRTYTEREGLHGEVPQGGHCKGWRGSCESEGRGITKHLFPAKSQKTLAHKYPPLSIPTRQTTPTSFGVVMDTALQEWSLRAA